MAFSTETRSIKTRLKRLEDMAGQGQRNCPSCRLLLRRPWPHADSRKPKIPDEDLVSVKCQHCQTKYVMYLGHIPKEDRDAWRMWFPISLEAWYLNPEAYALALWLSHKDQQNGIPANVTWQAVTPQATAHGRAKGQTAGQRLVLKLRREENELLEKKLRLLRAAFGVPLFQREQQLLIEAVRAKARFEAKTRGYLPGIEQLEPKRVYHLINAELEKIIWGKVRPQTKSALENVESAINELINARDAEKAKKEEAKESARQRAEESEKIAANEERAKKIEHENRHRRLLRMPRLPKDYEGPFKTYSELMRISHSNRSNRSVTI